MRARYYRTSLRVTWVLVGLAAAAAALLVDPWAGRPDSRPEGLWDPTPQPYRYVAAAAAFVFWASLSCNVSAVAAGWSAVGLAGRLGVTLLAVLGDEIDTTRVVLQGVLLVSAAVSAQLLTFVRSCWLLA